MPLLQRRSVHSVWGTGSPGAVPLTQHKACDVIQGAGSLGALLLMQHGARIFSIWGTGSPGEMPPMQHRAHILSLGVQDLPEREARLLLSDELERTALGGPEPSGNANQQWLS